MALRRDGRPSVPRYLTLPLSLRQLTIAHAAQVQQVIWQQGTKASKGKPDAAMTSHFIAIRVRLASRRIPRAADGSLPACCLLAGRMATPRGRACQVLSAP